MDSDSDIELVAGPPRASIAGLADGGSSPVPAPRRSRSNHQLLHSSSPSSPAQAQALHREARSSDGANEEEGTPPPPPTRKAGGGAGGAGRAPSEADAAAAEENRRAVRLSLGGAGDRGVPVAEQAVKRTEPPKPRARARPKAKAAVAEAEAPLAGQAQEDDEFFNMGKRPIVFRSKELGITEVTKGPTGAGSSSARAGSGSAGPTIVRASASRSPQVDNVKGKSKLQSQSQSQSVDPTVIDLDTDSEEEPGSSEPQLSGDDDEAEVDQPRRRGRGRPRGNGKGKGKATKRKKKAVNMPAWTRGKQAPKKDLDLEIVPDPNDSPSSASSKTPDSSPHRPITKKRSRSPTPPPVIDKTLVARDLEALQDNLIRSAHGGVMGQRLTQDEERREKEEREAIEAEEKDPHLREIKRRMRERMRSAQGSSVDGGREKEGERGKGIVVKLKVAMVWDPRDISGTTPMIRAFERPIELEIGIRELLQPVFDKLAQRANVPSSRIAMTTVGAGKRGGLGTRVFVGESLESVRIFADAELKGYNVDVYNYLRDSQRHIGSPPPPGTGFPRAASILSPPPRQPSNPSPSPIPSASPGSIETITITVRRGQKRDMDLTVKKTTSVLAIIKQFLKEDEGFVGEALTAKAKRCYLEFDGERMPHGTKVGETEIDDGDLCDIVIPDR